MGFHGGKPAGQVARVDLGRHPHDRSPWVVHADTATRCADANVQMTAGTRIAGNRHAEAQLVTLATSRTPSPG